VNHSDEHDPAPEGLPAKRRWQFSLRRLIAAVAGSAVIFAAVRLMAMQSPLGVFLAYLLAISWPWAAGGAAAAMTCWCRGQPVQVQSDQFGCLVGLWGLFFWIVYLLGTIVIAVGVALSPD
jgi:hypothetical protein